jgi:hypothetical protein
MKIVKLILKEVDDYGREGNKEISFFINAISIKSNAYIKNNYNYDYEIKIFPNYYQVLKKYDNYKKYIELDNKIYNIKNIEYLYFNFTNSIRYILIYV